MECDLQHAKNAWVEMSAKERVSFLVWIVDDSLDADLEETKSGVIRINGSLDVNFP